MNENLYKFGEESEVKFSKTAFKGKSAGLISKYGRFLDTVIQTRIVLFVLIFYSLSPILFHYFEEEPNLNFVIAQQIVFSSLYFVAVIFYNRSRIISTVIAIIPPIVNIIGLLMLTGYSILRPISIQIGILCFIIFGLVRHFQMKQIQIKLKQQSDDV